MDLELLECPLCTFSVLPEDNYVLQLHFEQVHTEDSPFRIENDPEPLPRPLPGRPQPASSNEADTPSDLDDENSVLCPEPDCGELILLSDFNNHLDLHAAATLSFDETTGKYHSQPLASSRGSMQSSSNTLKPTGTKAPSFLTRNPDNHATTSSGPSRRATIAADEDASKLKKKPAKSRGNSTGSEKSTLSRSIAAFNPFTKAKAVKASQNTARLGRAELGPHAWEDRMPKWLHDQLANGPKITIVNRIGRDGRLIKQEQVQNETPGIVPILAQLSALDRTVKQAYYCHPSTLHIGKTPKEGGFCGYRNIQMLISYIQGARAQGVEEFPGRTPGVLKLQDLIERAWDKGINEIGRQQTGGIRDTRKYIGTPEAQALFLSSQIDCAVELFTDSPDGHIEAHEQLLYAIESYFKQAAVRSDGSNVCKTLLPPIYLQQPGHSVTIVGFERRKDGSTNLVVFDPMYHTSPAMHALLGRRNIKTPRPEVLQAYRRGTRQLGKHAAFECLMLTAFPPLFPAWDILRQFPDCRYVYAFFRSKTLGYDVYPEDHFLRNFPWQQYGGLWIIDDARFARAEKMNPLVAQALRRITSEGAFTASGTYTTSSGSLSSGPVHHNLGQFTANMHGLRVSPNSSNQLPGSALSSSYDGTQPYTQSAESEVLNMVGMHAAPKIPQPDTFVQGPHFSRRYPGYPSPVSPSPTAKGWYPSPASGSRPLSPLTQSSPLSVADSDISGQLREPVSPSYKYAPDYQVKRHDSIHSCGQLNNIVNQTVEYVAAAKMGGTSIASPPRSGPPSPKSPSSPPRPVSPRTTMLKNMMGKHSLQSLGQNSSLFPQPFDPAMYIRGAGEPVTIALPNTSSSCASLPAIEIANGIEVSEVSPISPTGTMLRYTSHRPVDSGLLALRPLSEAQVAEYRFWRPCGRRICAFGCGGANEGEVMAARRLFRDVEEVVPEKDEEE